MNCLRINVLGISCGESGCTREKNVLRPSMFCACQDCTTSWWLRLSDPESAACYLKWTDLKFWVWLNFKFDGFYVSSTSYSSWLLRSVAVWYSLVPSITIWLDISLSKAALKLGSRYSNTESLPCSWCLCSDRGYFSSLCDRDCLRSLTVGSSEPWLKTDTFLLSSFQDSLGTYRSSSSSSFIFWVNWFFFSNRSVGPCSSSRAFLLPFIDWERRIGTWLKFASSCR